MRLIVDTDTGIDDALALMYLASLPEVDLAAVTTTHGNCTTESSTANARLVLDTCGLDRVPVVGGLSAPLAGELSTAWYVHGRDGLGDCGVAPPPGPPAPADDNAVVALLDLAARCPGEFDLLALGPLTNLGAALRVEPALLQAFRTVTIMGGTGPLLRPGDPDPTHGVGDPNTYHDAVAAGLVAAASGPTTTWVGVDVTLNVAAGADHLSRLAAATTPHGRLAAAITRFYLDFYESRSGTRALALHDPIAAMVAVEADIAARFVEGIAVVEGAAGAERCVLAPAAAPRAAVTRALAGCDGERVAELMSTTLERPINSR
jgi:purine nucleosidase